ncbi:cell wall-binding repeat-containing protein [Okibacterium fritillariae]|uniref:cell wall-binding repeat-containing protein n=1 Tax=Okibacterium fritillariae TaxID=123320 RepID=UPI004055469B
MSPRFAMPHALRARPLAALLAAALALGVMPLAAQAAQAAPTTGTAASSVRAAITDPQTVVSLTFDDTNADQMAALPILDAAGIKATFYAITGYIGAPGYLTLPQLQGIGASGHEIGGHSVTHPDFTTITAAEATREACNSRATLADWGFANVRSFAYPFAAVDAAAEKAVADCGYNSARGLGDIESRFGCAGCGFSEALPPADPFYTRALDQFDSSWTLTDLQNAVLNAENNGGGWVQLTFHHVCDNACDSLAISPALLKQFTDWLTPRAATENTVVKTVGDAVGGAVKPVVSQPLPPAPGAGVNGIINPSLEDVATSGIPACWSTAGFGTNTRTFSTVTPGRTGVVAEKLVVTGHTDGDGQLLSTFDQGACAPTVTAGHTYSLRAWFTSTAPTQINVYLRNTAGLWSYYTSSAYFAAAATWTQAEWTTPALPAGTTGLSFGLNMFQNGEITTDDYALYDTVGAPAVPGTLVAGTPTITGTAKVGETLTANPGTWTPASTTFTYQWLRGATDIAGATSATYTATAADRGAQLSVRVTGSAPDWTPPTATATSAATSAVLAGNVTTNRLAGADRFGTAIAVAQTFAPGVARLYIANGYGFPDALSAAPAAAHFSSPLLLTAPEALPAAVKAEIKRLKPAKIVIAGGVNAVSNSVLAELKALAPTVRLSGDDRFGTSRAIAADAFGTNAPTAYVATGYDFPDALTASAAAAKAQAPVVLVPGTNTTLDPATLAALKTLKTTTVKIAGGPNAVSVGIENGLKAGFGPTAVKRLSGADRYATAEAINLDAFGSSATVYLASGVGFPDALVGAALAGTKGSPVYLTGPGCVVPSVLQAIDRLGTTVVTLLGGPNVLSADVAALKACG